MSKDSVIGGVVDAAVTQWLESIRFPVKQGAGKRYINEPTVEWLGLIVCALTQSITIPAVKVEKLSTLIAPVVKGPPRRIRRSAIRSIAGLFQFVLKAIPSTRALAAELYSLGAGDADYVWLSNDLQHDLRIIMKVVRANKGGDFRAAIIHAEQRGAPVKWCEPDSQHLLSDAAGTGGLCGVNATNGDHFIFEFKQGQRVNDTTVCDHEFATEKVSTTWQELLPCYGALCIWGSDYYGQTVRWQCDNQATVAIIKRGWSKSRPVNRVLRAIQLLCAKYNCVFRPEYINTHVNCLADAGSRLKFNEFYSLLKSQGIMGRRLALPQKFVAILEHSLKAR